ncbi:MAG TPA: hypothetical protein VGS04_05265 [Nitrososphaerales archaeon]|nr:hypothetical protein [Nitrososphaerales archaeon]
MNRYQFWYFYFCDGRSGLLVDFVKFVDKVYVRTALFSPERNVVFESEHLPADAENFAGRQGALPVRIGTAELAEARSRGAAGQVTFEVKMEPGRTIVEYVPRFLSWLTGIPQLTSHLETSFTGVAEFGAETLRYEKVPGVYTCYWMKDFAPWEWRFISAMDSDDDLFALEFVMSNYLGGWRASGYLRYAGAEYRAQGILDSLIKVQVLSPGVEENGRRNFALSLKWGERSFLVEAQAPLDRFVILHSGYGGRVQTTLFGDCKVTAFASDGVGGRRKLGEGSAVGNCLLESKDRG